MKQRISSFLRDENGQDLVEYALLLAFVAFAAAALFIGANNDHPDPKTATAPAHAEAQPKEVKK